MSGRAELVPGCGAAATSPNFFRCEDNLHLTALAIRASFPSIGARTHPCPFTGSD